MTFRPVKAVCVLSEGHPSLIITLDDPALPTMEIFHESLRWVALRERGGRGQNAISVLSDWEDRVSTTLPDGRTFRGVTEDPAIEELAKRFLNLLVARELCEGLEISIERIEP